MEGPQWDFGSVPVAAAPGWIEQERAAAQRAPPRLETPGGTPAALVSGCGWGAMAEPDEDDPRTGGQEQDWSDPEWAHALRAGRMWEAFGLQPGAPRDEIERVYRRRSLDCHPDRHTGSRSAKALFVSLTDAKETMVAQEVAPAFTSGLLLLSRAMAQVVSSRLVSEPGMPPVHPAEPGLLQRTGAPSPYEQAHPGAQGREALLAQRERLRQTIREEEDLLAGLASGSRRPVGLRRELRSAPVPSLAGRGPSGSVGEGGPQRPVPTSAPAPSGPGEGRGETPAADETWVPNPGGKWARQLTPNQLRAVKARFERRRQRTKDSGGPSKTDQGRKARRALRGVLRARIMREAYLPLALTKARRSKLGTDGDPGSGPTAGSSSSALVPWQPPARRLAIRPQPGVGLPVRPVPAWGGSDWRHWYCRPGGPPEDLRPSAPEKTPPRNPPRRHRNRKKEKRVKRQTEVAPVGPGGTKRKPPRTGVARSGRARRAQKASSDPPRGSQPREAPLDGPHRASPVSSLGGDAAPESSAESDSGMEPPGWIAAADVGGKGQPANSAAAGSRPALPGSSGGPATGRG